MSIGSHYHKNEEDGMLYKYQVYKLDGQGNAVFKCYDDKCASEGIYELDSRKFIVTVKHNLEHKEHDYVNNCDKNDDIYADICPEEKPILKDEKCVLKHCTKEEYENNTCIISNPIVKTQWIDEFPYVSALDKPLYSTFGQLNDDILFETNIGNPFSDRKIYTLNEKSRGFFDELPFDTIKLNSNLFSTNGIGTLLKINGKINYMRLSHHETIEMYDFDEYLEKNKTVK